MPAARSSLDASRSRRRCRYRQSLPLQGPRNRLFVLDNEIPHLLGRQRLPRPVSTMIFFPSANEQGVAERRQVVRRTGPFLPKQPGHGTEHRSGVEMDVPAGHSVRPPRSGPQTSPLGRSDIVPVAAAYQIPEEGYFRRARPRSRPRNNVQGGAPCRSSTRGAPGQSTVRTTGGEAIKWSAIVIIVLAVLCFSRFVIPLFA